MNARRPLVLVGAGGFARETVELVKAINDREARFELLGFLDDDPRLEGEVRSGCTVLGPTERVHERSDVAVVVCVGSPRDPSVRGRVVDRLGLDGSRFETLVHPGAHIASSAEVGVGTVVHAGTVFTADVKVGRHVAIMPNVVLTHDDVVGDGVTIGAGARIAGNVLIEHDAYVGSGACVREGTSVGAMSLVGMGAVVLADVPAGEVWAGNPARFLRSVSHHGSSSGCGLVDSGLRVTR